MLVNVKNDGETISNFTLLVHDSQSTFIRENFIKQLKLKRYSRTINISSIKDEPEKVKVKEISLMIYDMDHKNEEAEVHITKKNVQYAITKFTY